MPRKKNIKPYHLHGNTFRCAYKFDLGRKKAIIESVNYKKIKNKLFIKASSSSVTSKVFLSSGTLKSTKHHNLFCNLHPEEVLSLVLLI